MDKARWKCGSIPPSRTTATSCLFRRLRTLLGIDSLGGSPCPAARKTGKGWVGSSLDTTHDGSIFCTPKLDRLINTTMGANVIPSGPTE